MAAPPRPLVHLELHTTDLLAAHGLYAELCGWQPHPIATSHGSYLALELGSGIGGGIVECATRRPLWLPYVRVDEIEQATDRARRLGARVLLEPREGPAGWRSVIATATGGELAFWQQKR
jgi:uncharacterized protein